MNNKKPTVFYKVKRAYMFDPLTRLIRHILIDPLGMMFIPGYGWASCIDRTLYKIVELPGEIDHHDWWGGWWTSNWKLPDWAWCNMGPRVEFIHSYRVGNGFMAAY